MVLQALQRLQEQELLKLRGVELQGAWGVAKGSSNQHQQQQHQQEWKYQQHHQQSKWQQQQRGGDVQAQASTHWHPKKQRLMWAKAQVQQPEQQEEEEEDLGGHARSLLSQLLSTVLVGLPGHKPKELTVLLFSVASMGLPPLPWWWLQPVLQAAKVTLVGAAVGPGHRLWGWGCTSVTLFLALRASSDGLPLLVSLK
jgi:hypothetical protein